MFKYLIFTDGASRGNPGPASCGYLIKSEDGVIWVQDGVFLGNATNNYAEYMGVKHALERLIADFSAKLPTQVILKADSQLVVRQLSGQYKIKNLELKLIYDQIKELEKKVGNISYQHIPRSENFLADRLANMALDKHE
jgi:ribonuclease HI